jgi:ribosomal protein S21
MTTVHVEVTKSANETPTNLLRRFTRRVQGSGIIRKAKSLRFLERPKSKLVRKNRALRRIERRKQNDKLIKLGKLDPERKGRPRR